MSLATLAASTFNGHGPLELLQHVQCSRIPETSAPLLFRRPHIYIPGGNDRQNSVLDEETGSALAAGAREPCPAARGCSVCSAYRQRRPDLDHFYRPFVFSH